LTRPEQADALPANLWTAPFKIRFSHCDPGGVVYTPAYFDLFNATIEDWFTGALGLNYHAFLNDRRIGFGYVHSSADFFHPGRMGETYQFGVWLTRIGTTSYETVMPVNNGSRELLRGRLVTVVTNLDTKTKIPIPDDLRAALTAYQERLAS
jgi:4-hydroxybenzoyl-CoA thioesterase